MLPDTKHRFLILCTIRLMDGKQANVPRRPFDTAGCCQDMQRRQSYFRRMNNGSCVCDGSQWGGVVVSSVVFLVVLSAVVVLVVALIIGYLHV